MAYPNRSSALLVVVHGLALPVCHGCGCGLPPPSGNGGSKRKWCSRACRTFGYRRATPDLMRSLDVAELEKITLEALSGYSMDRVGWILNQRAMALLTLVRDQG